MVLLADVLALAEAADIDVAAARRVLVTQDDQATPLLTECERDIVDRLGAIASDMSQRVIADGGANSPRWGDINEMCLHVHALQNMVLAQAAARAYPGTYRLLGVSLREDPPRDPDYVLRSQP